MSNINEHSIIQHADNVISRVIEDETILVMAQQGQVKVVNEIGGLIWQLSEQRISVSEIVEAIVSEYRVEYQVAMKDAQDYIHVLVDLGALVLSE